MGDAFAAGLLVGLFAAVLVGTAALPVMETAIHRGLGTALAAGTGIATGDALWAALAVLAGRVLGHLVAPWVSVVQWIALATFATLVVLAVRELARPGPATESGHLAPAAPVRAYGEFLLFTVTNAVTIVFFVSLIVASAPGSWIGDSVSSGVFFVLGVAVASLSWQFLLAAAGARRGRVFSMRTRRRVLLVDCVLLVLMIVYTAVQLSSA